ncbi:MAG: hypothetical protein JRG93_20175 [Deltaproteobacteria bacterium]|nr:hypothetical protein [Deltaproteobacteria bacterium]
MGRRSRDYEETLLERLRDREYAADYLNAVLAEDGADPTGDFLAALRLVAKAQGLTITQLSESSAFGSRLRALHEDAASSLPARGGGPWSRIAVGRECSS